MERNKNEAQSIELFDDMEKAPRSRKQKVWAALRPFTIALSSLIIVGVTVFGAMHILLSKYFYPVDSNDATPVKVVIPKGYGASAIAKILYEACGEGEEGLIANKAVFKVYVDFLGKSNNLRAGTYYFSKNMGIPQIVDELCMGNPPRATVDLVFTEGKTIEGIAEDLVKNGVLDSVDTFLSMCKSGEDFMNYSFMEAVDKEKGSQRDYMLEGYMFPNTYNFFLDSTESEVITKFLVKFLDVFTDDYREQAEELGMSIDDIVILASMIEKEAKTEDFSKVSAVFHNRLREDMTLGSDATIQYIVKKNTLKFSEEDLESQSLYNTYKYKGLPIGPICNPGEAAIKAALNPDEDYVKEKYLYFCLKDTETGELVFAKTLAEHQKNVDKYSGSWE